jgi:hypothetical protein
MSDDIFIRTKRLLENHVDLLNQYSIGNPYADEAQDIVNELNVLIKNKSFIKHLEQEIEEEERKMVSDDLAQRDIESEVLCGWPV